MDTSKPSQTQTSQLIQNNSNRSTSKWLDVQATKFERARFFWMPIYITAQSCLASIACGFILHNYANTIMLCICASVAMMSNAVFIALGPPKICLTIVYLSFMVNTIFILINF
ncbi:hypothetical protein CNR22_15940 [Sphingobacteriaceae bacterium]|nr:hypothetical protein CNR22_15940 [Sphingobacteriaceae bacterium]